MIEEKQLKDTLNLPSTTLAMRANAANREIEIQKFWEENKIYKKMLEKNKGNKSFILHDGPPYLSSDKIHIGTAMNKILKDIVLKYKTQKGFYTPYIPGYDAHGLPIENAVVKNIKGGRNALTPLELRQKCREFAAKNLKGQEENFRRLGVLGDWEHPYVTIAPEFEAHQVDCVSVIRFGNTVAPVNDYNIVLYVLPRTVVCSPCLVCIEVGIFLCRRSTVESEEPVKTAVVFCYLSRTVFGL